MSRTDRCSFAGCCGYRGEEFSPCTQSDTDVPQVFIGEMWQSIQIDLVLGEQLGIFAKPDLLQPATDFVSHVPLDI